MLVKQRRLAKTEPVSCIVREDARFLVTAEASAPLTCFHGFRHNFRDGRHHLWLPQQAAVPTG